MEKRDYQRQPGTGEPRFQDREYFKQVKNVGAYTGSEKHDDDFVEVTRTPEEVAESERNYRQFEKNRRG